MKDILSFIRSKKSVGLYIGKETIDLVVLKSSFTGPKLVKFGQAYINPKDKKDEILPGGLSGGSVTSESTLQKSGEDIIVETIIKLFKENNIKLGDVVTALPSEDVMVRYFQMPKIPKQERPSAISFEAKRYIPFRMEDVVTDYQIIEYKGPGAMDVVFVAVRQKVVSRFVNLLERAGLRPIIVEPDSFSIIRVLNAGGQIGGSENTTIINIDTKVGNIIILRHNVPYLIRDIPLEEDIGGEKSFEPIFEKLLSEIKLSFDFYEKQFPSETIDKLIIHSSLPLGNWHELVGKELQVPVEVGDPLRGLRIRKDMVPPKLSVAFGLALRGLGAPGININLYKEKFLLYKSKQFFLKLVFLEASIAVFLLIILKVFCLRAIAPFIDEYNHTLSERPKLELALKEDSIAGLERIKNEMESKKQALEGIFSGKTYLTPKLAILADATPSNIWLTELNYEEKSDKKDASRITRRLGIKGCCIIDGKSTETDIVSNFLANLKESGLLKEGLSKAEIVSVTKKELKGKKAANFEILITGP